MEQYFWEKSLDHSRQLAENADPWATPRFNLLILGLHPGVFILIKLLNWFLYRVQFKIQSSRELLWRPRGCGIRHSHLQHVWLWISYFTSLTLDPLSIIEIHTTTLSALEKCWRLTENNLQKACRTLPNPLKYSKMLKIIIMVCKRTLNWLIWVGWCLNPSLQQSEYSKGTMETCLLIKNPKAWSTQFN